MPGDHVMSNWTLFSNHGHVLFCIARDPEARLRDVAANVGITERAVQKIVRDLQDGRMISVKKSGRRNCYRIHRKQPLRHEIEASCTIRDLIKVVNKDQKTVASDADLTDDTKVLQKEHESHDRVVDTALASAKMPRSDQSESIKRTPAKTEPEEPVPSKSIEKQQGTLF